MKVSSRQQTTLSYKQTSYAPLPPLEKHAPNPVPQHISCTLQTDDTYDVPVDPKQQDRATAFRLRSFKRPHMRAFHFAWFGFFMAFVSWFAFAPLMKEIKKDLGMTKNEVYNANISSVSSTVVSRFIVGPLCDTFGARIISTTLLIMGCIPTFFGGLVNSAVDVAVIRFFIGVMGATFVCTQFWSSQIFAKEFVGTANATTGGWGNLGGGVTQVNLTSHALKAFRCCTRALGLGQHNK